MKRNRNKDNNKEIKNKEIKVPWTKWAMAHILREVFKEK